MCELVVCSFSREGQLGVLCSVHGEHEGSASFSKTALVDTAIEWHLPNPTVFSFLAGNKTCPPTLH